MKYETELDKLREAKVARAVAAHVDMQLGGGMIVPVKCKEYYPCDYVLVEQVDDHETIVGMLEVKIRDRQYPTYMISLAKASQLVHMAAYAGVRPLLAVFWEDTGKMGLANLMEVDKTPRIGGRRDRNNADDVEPVIHIPIDQFETWDPKIVV